jgi:hypothetical protein
MKSATFAAPRKPPEQPAAKAARPKPLMGQVREHLNQRRDVRILADGDGTTGPRIVGVQLKRTWRKQIHNPNSMSPHEREYWEYYGQAFLIEEALLNKHFELDPEQVLLQEDMGEVGTVVVMATKFQDVLEAMGREPDDVQDYLDRVEK